MLIHALHQPTDEFGGYWGVSIFSCHYPLCFCHVEKILPPVLIQRITVAGCHKKRKCGHWSFRLFYFPRRNMASPTTPSINKYAVCDVNNELSGAWRPGKSKQAFEPVQAIPSVD
jgi:hypothetical protein